MAQRHGKNLSEALKIIVDKFGKDALLDEHKVRGILSDLMPGSNTEINWMLDAINTDIVKILLSGDSDREALIDKAKVKLDNQYVSELRRDYIIDSIAYGLGWKSTSVGDLEDYKNRFKKPTKKSDSKNEKKDNKEKRVNTQKPSSYDSRNTNRNKPSSYDSGNTKTDKPKSYDGGNTKTDKPKSYDGGNTKTNNPNSNDDKKKKTNKPKSYDNGNTKKKNSNNKKGGKGKLIIIPIIALILIGLIVKTFMGPDVEVQDVYFNSDVSQENSTYVFNDSLVNMNVALDGDNINTDNIRYEVEDQAVCVLIGDGSKCNILFKQGVNKATDIIIYYDDDEIYRVNVAYRQDGAVGDGSVDVNNQEVNIDTSGNSLTQSEADAMRECLDGYYRNYGDAVYSGDISYLDSFLYPNGPFYKSTESNLKSWYSKSIESRVTSYTITSIRREEGQFIVSAVPEFDVYNQKGHFYMKESMDYIFAKSSAGFKIYDVKNWKQLQKKEIN